MKSESTKSELLQREKRRLSSGSGKDALIELARLLARRAVRERVEVCQGAPCSQPTYINEKPPI
jgi:cob(I)alamin adenosyltransferase